MKRWNNHQYRHVKKTREALERKGYRVFNVDDSKGNRCLLATAGAEITGRMVGMPTLLVVVKCACKYHDEEVEDLVDRFVEEMCAALHRATGVARELWVWKAYQARPVAVRRAW